MLRIIGIGNRMYGDDGIGPCLAGGLKSCSRYNPREVHIVPLDLPNHGDIVLLKDADHVIFIDSVVDESTMIYKIDVTKATVEELLELAQSGSGHGISPTSLIALAKVSGILSSQTIHLLLIGPLSPSFGEGLSDKAVSLAIDAVGMLVAMVRRQGYAIDVDMECLQSFLRDVCSDPLSPLDIDSRKRL